MSSQVADQIEQAVITILLEAINARNGRPFTDSNSLLTFISVICTNAATLQHTDYSSMKTSEKVEVVIQVVPEVYNTIKEQNLVPKSVSTEIDSLLLNLNILREKITVVISFYDMTTQLTGLPSFNDASKAGLEAIVKSLPRIEKKTCLRSLKRFFCCFSKQIKEKTIKEQAINELKRESVRTEEPVNVSNESLKVSEVNYDDTVQV